MEPFIAKFVSISPRQRLQHVWQVCGVRHGCPVDQRRDHPNVATKGRRNFQPNEVLRIIKPTPSSSVGDRQPLLANERHQGIARAYRLLNDLHEVQAGLNRVDVHEHVLSPKVLAEPIIEPSSPPATIVAPIADENPGHSGLLPQG
jgi:hypothetical protein